MTDKTAELIGPMFIVTSLASAAILAFFAIVPSHWRPIHHAAPLLYDTIKDDTCGQLKVWTEFSTKTGWTVWLCSKDEMELHHG